MTTDPPSAKDPRQQEALLPQLSMRAMFLIVTATAASLWLFRRAATTEGTWTYCAAMILGMTIACFFTYAFTFFLAFIFTSSISALSHGARRLASPTKPSVPSPSSAPSAGPSETKS